MKRPTELVTVAFLVIVLIAVWQLLPLWAGWFHVAVAP